MTDEKENKNKYQTKKQVRDCLTFDTSKVPTTWNNFT